MSKQKACNLKNKQPHSATLEFSGPILHYLAHFDSN